MTTNYVTITVTTTMNVMTVIAESSESSSRATITRIRHSSIGAYAVASMMMLTWWPYTLMWIAANYKGESPRNVVLGADDSPTAIADLALDVLHHGAAVRTVLSVDVC